jgi:hypothetical protein
MWLKKLERKKFDKKRGRLKYISTVVDNIISLVLFARYYYICYYYFYYYSLFYLHAIDIGPYKTHPNILYEGLH